MWQVDPSRSVVKVGTLIDGAYQFVAFTDEQSIVSVGFPNLSVTASQILTVGQ